MAAKLSIEDFRALFDGDDEFAVIDPRDKNAFIAGHLLSASHLPLDRLGAAIGHLVPRAQTLCILCDDNGGEAGQAVELLDSLGYGNCVVLDGGLAAWENAGGAIFSGSSVPGKAFGEFVEKSCHTPAMTAAQYYQLYQQGKAPMLIDTRTLEEHESYCIPGALLCPGAELLYRLMPMADADTEIVLHCGGRTRSIIGAQTLIDAGYQNVHALENGTMAWQFEGLDLEHGNTDSLPPPKANRLPAIQDLAQQLAESWYIDRVSSIEAQAHRSRYLIDVRSREEYEAGHIRGSIHVPGGHLLQNVDRYLVVRNATVILIDGDRVRAVTTAIWLRRMGWRRVFVFSLDDDKEGLEYGAGSMPSPVEDRDLDPADFDDREALMARNHAYLEWEIALFAKLPEEPAAPYVVKR